MRLANIILLFTLATPTLGQKVVSFDGPYEVVVGNDVQVSRLRPDRLHWEPVITSNPENPRNLLACWIDGEQGSKPESFVVVYSSFDGGRSWRNSLRIAESEREPVVDPSCAFGGGGVAYATAMTRSALIYKSTDSGKTWKKAARLGIRGWDREYLTIDTTGSRNRGQLYFHYNGTMRPLVSDGGLISGVDLWRLAKGGINFRGLARLATTSQLMMGNGTVLSDGTFVVIAILLGDGRSDLSKGNQIVVIRGEDNNSRFSPSSSVAAWNAEPSLTCGPLPMISADTSSSVYKDRLYAVWRDQMNGRSAIMAAYSIDRGNTWSSPIVVNDGKLLANSAEGDGCTPAVAVNSSGVVGVLWYERYHHANSDLSRSFSHEARFSASIDGGQTFLPSVSLSRPKPLPRNFRIGETAGLVASPDGKFLALWIENRIGNPQVYYAPISVKPTRTIVALNTKNAGEKVLKDKIYNTEIIPWILQSDDDSDWVVIEKRVISVYGSRGREMLLKAKPIYFAKRRDWIRFYASLSQYTRRYGTDDLDPGTLNNFAWAIFELFEDRHILERAAAWSLESILRQPNESEPIDTHANILHRLGRTDEAIAWEEKALTLAKSEAAKKHFQTTIDKMKKGEKTWP